MKPERSAGEKREFGWTLPQRRALLVLLGALLIFLTIRALTNRTYVTDPQPDRGPREDELASRVDPNSADWQTLATIPSLGEKRAKDIVAYRQRVLSAHPGAVVFQTSQDLRAVKGIGRATLENLRPYLAFPVPDQPSTSP